MASKSGHNFKLGASTCQVLTAISRQTFGQNLWDFFLNCQIFHLFEIYLFNVATANWNFYSFLRLSYLFIASDISLCLQKSLEIVSIAVLLNSRNIG